ncbi:YggS family pyridoxal phosphate-dependent enzyme [Nesterenkonia flava]|uniref:Pyridoxal phosphate homeostasis protein n=1 Tax=Nesterenkonia flava TaxID=469799 RepID=A0ABU1FV59_9MICC|nr:YggS family pyridoxal phosphate-dependent enzyme [Nesterenkonia flava]MDR5712546.1 YggS family pyridoxal phosphate-dependent enzyme [Nesterenkonia flava]
MTDIPPSTPVPSGGSSQPDARRAELAENLTAVRQRIADAVTASGTHQAPELIVVTKYFPAADVQRLYDLGVREVGENKDQEASAKALEVGSREGLRWHFIGQLQSNKAKSVLRYADAVHSVDRTSLLKSLIKAATRARQEGARSTDLECFIQVDLRQPVPADGRGGADPGQIPALAEMITAAEGLRLAGLMAVAPLDEPAGPAFERLAALSQQLRSQHPEATGISAGMSQDLEAAVAHGATHLRIGRDVLGARPSPR